MSDFKSFVNGKSSGAGDNPGEQEVRDFYNAHKGKSEDELLTEIFRQAAKSKANGTLSAAEIDAFANMVAPRLNPRQRKRLQEIVRELKR